MFDYSPLWETMQNRGVSQYQLLKAGIDNKTLDSLKKNKNITMVTLESCVGSLIAHLTMWCAFCD